MENNIQKGQLCPTCKRYNSRYVVVNAIVEHKGKILLIKRGIDPGYGKWALPGGFLDWDETIQEGVIREVQEETGLSVEVKEMLGVFDSTKRNSQKIAFTFIVNVIGQNDVKVQESEVLDFQWVTIESLPEGVAFDHNVMLERYRDLLNK